MYAVLVNLKTMSYRKVWAEFEQFLNFPKLQNSGRHEINMASYDVIMMS